MPKVIKLPKKFQKRLAEEIRQADQSWCRICYGNYPPSMMFKWTHDGETRLGPICAYCARGLHSEIQHSGILEQ